MPKSPDSQMPRCPKAQIPKRNIMTTALHGYSSLLTFKKNFKIIIKDVGKMGSDKPSAARQ